MTTLIALLTLFATTFGVFIGWYDDARDKVWAYVAVRALLLVASYGASLAVFWLMPPAWLLAWCMVAMLLVFYALAKVTYHVVCASKLNHRR